EPAGLVVAAPHEPVDGGDRVAAPTADQRREDGVAVPAGEAHPDEVALRADEGAALAVGDHRVVAKRVWLDLDCAQRRAARVSPASAAASVVATSGRCVVSHSWTLWSRARPSNIPCVVASSGLGSNRLSLRPFTGIPEICCESKPVRAR